MQVQLREADVSFDDFLSKASAHHEGQKPHIVDAYETCNILFSSGTTGKLRPCLCTQISFQLVCNFVLLADVHSAVLSFLIRNDSCRGYK